MAQFPAGVALFHFQIFFYRKRWGTCTFFYRKFEPVLKQAVIKDTAPEEAPENIVLGTAKGGLYEALAADMLYKRGYRDIYYYKDAKSTSEIEFLITDQEGLLPIEIKAGRKKANSLNNILRNDLIAKGYKLSGQNVGQVGKRITLPVYMLIFLPPQH